MFNKKIKIKKRNGRRQEFCPCQFNGCTGTCNSAGLSGCYYACSGAVILF